MKKKRVSRQILKRKINLLFKHSISVSPSGSKHEFLYDDSVAVNSVIINALTNFRGKGPSSGRESHI